MNNEFEKGISEMRNVKMSAGEKSNILKSILGKPIESPYMRYFNISTFSSKQSAAFVFSLLLIITTTSALYASGGAVPGDSLYSVKTEVFEPIVGKLKMNQENQLEWEAEKIERRIIEAEKLAEDNKLDEEKVKMLEKKIQKTSAIYAAVAEKAASSTSTTTEGRREKLEKLKRAVVEKIEDRKEEKVKRLKDSALKGFESKKDNDDDAEDDD